MEKIAVIDVGSNSVRLMFVADGKVLYKTLETTRLGEGIALSKTLKEGAIERTANAVARFYDRAKSEGANVVRVFATAAVRSATNGRDFVVRVQELRPVEVEVLSGVEEAEIGILGALGTRDGTVIDVGGASTEIIVQKNGKILYEKSVDVGVVRLKDLAERDRQKLQAIVDEAVEAFGEIPFEQPIYLVGGTATTLGAVHAGLQVYSAKEVTGVTLTAENLRKLTDRLFFLSVEEIAQIPCVEEKRADVLAGGALWLRTIAERFSLKYLTVSDSDNLEGYAVKRGLMKK